MHKPLIIIADPDAERGEATVATFNGGYACIRVEDAREALRVARERTPAAVVVDFPFPVADHQCLSAALHQQQETSGIPIIAYSGWNFSRTRAKAQELGCSVFVPHEDGPRAVVDAVEGVVRGSQHAVA